MHDKYVNKITAAVSEVYGCRGPLAHRGNGAGNEGACGKTKFLNSLQLSHQRSLGTLLKGFLPQDLFCSSANKYKTFLFDVARTSVVNLFENKELDFYVSRAG